VLTAIAEARGLARGEIGIASIDLKRPVLTLSQFNDGSTYVKLMTKLHILQPLEIIMPDTACEKANILFNAVTNSYQDTYLAMVPRKYFNEERGMSCIKHLCLPELASIEVEVKTKYYSLCAAAALLKYIEYIQNVVYAPGSLKIVYKGSEQTTMIDASTSKNLELLMNLNNHRSSETLFGTLNSTRTHMGFRLLRANILQPPCNGDTINMRLDVVSDLIRDEENFFSLQAIVGRFLDVDHLISACVQVPKEENIKTHEAKISHVICLKHTLELVEPLKNVLAESENALLKACHVQLQDTRYQLILEKLSVVIAEDSRYQRGTLASRMQKCFAVKPNINGLLDVARRSYSEVVEDINDLIQEEARKNSMPIKCNYNSARGFHMSLYLGDKTKKTYNLPAEYVKTSKFKNTLSFTCKELIKMNDRVKDSLREIYMMSNMVVSQLLSDIRQHMDCLYKLSECVAMLDMLIGFTHNCTLSDYVRPEFTDTLAVKGGRHPILDKISCESPVANNIYASHESNFIVITGPNMSGKSTYLRQIALLQVMAQVGSFVPAEYASFRLTDQIFSRIGSEEDIESNASSFMVEMKDMNYILRSASDKSLIIMDELGRGTNVDEAIGICHAICEHLISTKAFSFLATHFAKLTDLEALYPNVTNYHFAVERMFSEEAQGNKLIYTHSLQRGKTMETQYGIDLAASSTLPVELVENARKISSVLGQRTERREEEDEGAVYERAVFKLGSRIMQAARNSSKMADESLKSYLQNLKEQYYSDLGVDPPAQPPPPPTPEEINLFIGPGTP
ncbi:hypothetical protein CAPTEDRAFT_92723, partial [Capitella teleta]